MARILVHALAATAGGGKTYLHNLLKQIGRDLGAHQWLLLPPTGSDQWRELAGPNLSILPGNDRGRGLRRVLFDQWELRRLVRDRGIDLILATGNFGMLRPPVPQVLLNRNALYFSREHVRQLRRRCEYRELLAILLRRRMALASIRSSAMNVVPTQAFADDIRRRLPALPIERFCVIPHGFDHDAFFAGHDCDPVAPARRPGVFRLLMVSHYNYFRNFETLLAAVAIFRNEQRLPLELVLTTKLAQGVRDHRYDTSAAARLLQSSGIADSVIMVGTVPHERLHALYQTADVVVCPSYCESFGHPLVEAMASARPVVASDHGVHREVCRNAAEYFPTFDAAALAGAIRRVLEDQTLAKRLALAGPLRATDFSWDAHFAQLVEMMDQVLVKRNFAWQTTALTS